MSELNFVIGLSEYRSPLVFNPWGETDAEHDVGPEAPVIRRLNLVAYLGLRPRVEYLFVGEALGYQGGHFSGVALTCERMLLGYHKVVKPEDIFGSYQPRRSSDPMKLEKAILQQQGFNEPTDTVVWQALQDFGFDSMKICLWNIFPFHPYKEGNLLSNRTPTQQELEVGFKYFQLLRERYPDAQVVAIGRKCQETLSRFGVECPAVRHPSMGGVDAFRYGMARLKGIEL